MIFFFKWFLILFILVRVSMGFNFIFILIWKILFFLRMVRIWILCILGLFIMSWLIVKCIFWFDLLIILVVLFKKILLMMINIIVLINMDVIFFVWWKGVKWEIIIVIIVRSLLLVVMEFFKNMSLVVVFVLFRFRILFLNKWSFFDFKLILCVILCIVFIKIENFSMV